jgi:hypothetical protein
LDTDRRSSQLFSQPIALRTPRQLPNHHSLQPAAPSQFETWTNKLPNWEISPALKSFFSSGSDF